MGPDIAPLSMFLNVSASAEFISSMPLTDKLCGWKGCSSGTLCCISPWKDLCFLLVWLILAQIHTIKGDPTGKTIAFEASSVMAQSLACQEGSCLVEAQLLFWVPAELPLQHIEAPFALRLPLPFSAVLRCYCLINSLSLFKDKVTFPTKCFLSLFRQIGRDWFYCRMCLKKKKKQLKKLSDQRLVRISQIYRKLIPFCAQGEPALAERLD